MCRMARTSFRFPRKISRRAKRPLPQGSLVPVFKTKDKDGATYGRVAALNLKTGMAELGWVMLDPAELKPPNYFPPDDDLVPLSGVPTLTMWWPSIRDMARYLVHQSQGPDLLLCVRLTAQLSMANSWSSLRMGEVFPRRFLEYSHDGVAERNDVA